MTDPSPEPTLDAAVARIAGELAPEVLAAARERARELAVDRLAARLADAIVRSVATGAGARTAADRAPAVPDPTGTEPSRPGAPGEDRQALYAYGITWAGLELPEGLPTLTGNGRVERVVAGDGAGEIALLVSRIRAAELAVDEDDLSESGRLATLARGHDAVVRAAADRGPVLPLRFGTVVPDVSAAERLLAEHGAAAREQLDVIGDAREWGVRLVRRLERKPVARSGRTRDRDGMSGTAFLTSRARAVQEQEDAARAAERASEELQQTLGRRSLRSVRRGGSPGSSLLLDVTHLVPEEEEAAFLAAAGELREHLATDGLDLEVSGPWPAYSFVSLDPGGLDGA